MPTTVRVAIADDHPPTRAGVRSALEGNGFEICAEAATAPGAVEAAQLHRPDVCILDIHMPGDGIEAAAEIRRVLPGTEVVMLTVSHDDDSLLGALQAGAAGYILKDTDPDRLPEVLRRVLSGEAVLPRALVAQALTQFRERRRRRLGRSGAARLTSREREVLQGLVDGLSTRAIAERLGIAAVTVRTHIAAILRKLEVSDRDAAIRVVMKR